MTHFFGLTKYYDSSSIHFAIDDSPKHATEYAKHGIPVKVPRKSYNKKLSSVDYYSDFDELLSNISSEPKKLFNVKSINKHILR